MNHTALLRIDTQESFTPEGGLPVELGRDIISGVNKITQETLERSGLVIDSVDFHPIGHISFASRFGVAPYLPHPLNPSDRVWTDHSIGGTKDVELIAGIIDDPRIVKIYKWYERNRDAYSAFDRGVTKLTGAADRGYELDVGAKTLEEVLSEAHIRTIQIVGLVTEVCVKANVLDALKYGFDVELIVDGIRGLTKEGHETTLRELASLNGKPNIQGKIQSVKII